MMTWYMIQRWTFLLSSEVYSFFSPRRSVWRPGWVRARFPGDSFLARMRQGKNLQKNSRFEQKISENWEFWWINYLIALNFYSFPGPNFLLERLFFSIILQNINPWMRFTSRMRASTTMWPWASWHKVIRAFYSLITRLSLHSPSNLRLCNILESRDRYFQIWLFHILPRGNKKPNTSAKNQGVTQQCLDIVLVSSFRLWGSTLKFGTSIHNILDSHWFWMDKTFCKSHCMHNWIWSMQWKLDI